MPEDAGRFPGSCGRGLPFVRMGNPVHAGRFFVFRLRMCIFRLKIHILRLRICILKLKMKFLYGCVGTPAQEGERILPLLGRMLPA